MIPRLLLGCAVNLDWHDGGLIDLEQCGSGGSVRLAFPPNAFTRPDGGGFVNTVRVEMAVLDPDNGITFTSVPLVR